MGKHALSMPWHCVPQAWISNAMYKWRNKQVQTQKPEGEDADEGRAPISGSSSQRAAAELLTTVDSYLAGGAEQRHWQAVTPGSVVPTAGTRTPGPESTLVIDRPGKSTRPGQGFRRPYVPSARFCIVALPVGDPPQPSVNIAMVSILLLSMSC